MGSFKGCMQRKEGLEPWSILISPITDLGWCIFSTALLWRSLENRVGLQGSKQEIGGSKSQTWNPHAVTNHLNFCMMAATVTWIYADYLDQAPKRCYAVNDRAHFAFSDVRKLITQAALDKDFDIVCPKSNKRKSTRYYAWSHSENRETSVL